MELHRFGWVPPIVHPDGFVVTRHAKLVVKRVRRDAVQSLFGIGDTFGRVITQIVTPDDTIFAGRHKLERTPGRNGNLVDGLTLFEQYRTCDLPGRTNTGLTNLSGNVRLC